MTLFSDEAMDDHHSTLLPSEFEIGIDEIDSQHKRLYSLLEDLRKVTNSGFGYAANTILAELEIETRIHFAVEESLMRLLRYPETDSHTAEHLRLTKQLGSFKRRAQDFDISSGLADFIQTWLIDHIVKDDRKLAAYLIANGLRP